MKKIIFLSLFIPSILCSQWVQQNSGVNQSFRKVFFINNQTGWACGSNRTIIKTTNGGTNWQILTTNPSAGFTNSIFFINPMTGWAACVYDSLIKTTDGGFNWSTYHGSTYDELHDVFFINSQTGWVSCGIGLIRKTTNSGLTWNTYYGVYWTIFDIQFIDVNTGWGVGGGQYGVIAKSTNGGINWQEQTSGTTNPLWGISMISNQTGWIVGGFVYSNTVLKTTNGGLNWFDQPSGITTGLIAVHFLNSLTGWASGSYGKILKTTDGGVTWTLYDTNYNLNSFWTIYFTDSLTGWTAGYWGRIYKTTDGGAIGIQPISSEIPNQFSLDQNYPNPFNPVTKIKFGLPLPSKGGAMKVQLIVYDILGREITQLIPPLGGGQEGLSPGMYEVEWDGSNFASGIYYCKLVANEFDRTIKMVLLK